MRASDVGTVSMFSRGNCTSWEVRRIKSEGSLVVLDAIETRIHFHSKVEVVCLSAVQLPADSL